MNASVKKQLIILVPIVLFACVLVFSEDESITKTEIASAEKLIGLSFDDAERDSMIDGLNEQLENYKVVREFHLQNSVMPAVLFNPIPTGFKFEEDQKPMQFSDYSDTKAASNSRRTCILLSR